MVLICQCAKDDQITPKLQIEHGNWSVSVESAHRLIQRTQIKLFENEAQGCARGGSLYLV